MPPSRDDATVRLQRIRADLDRAERYLVRIRRWDTAGIVAALLATSLATAVAGISAAVGQTLVTETWRGTCGVAAVLAGVATVATGLRQQFSSSERLAKSAACVGRLRGLEFALSVGGVAPDAADQQYRELLEQYPDLLAGARG